MINDLLASNINVAGVVSKKLIAAGMSGLVEISDDGIAWSPKNITGLTYQIYSLAKTKTGKYLFGSYPKNIYQTIDFESYVAIPVYPTTWNYAILAMAIIDTVIVACDAYGCVWRSVDDGLTWTLVYQPGSSTAINGVVAYGNRFVASANGSKILISDDLGLTWRIVSVSALFGSEHVKNISMAPDGTMMVNCSYYWKIAVSNDFGNTWVYKGMLTSVNCLFNFNGLWVAGAGSKIYTSSDDGVTWILREANTLGAVNDFCATENGIWAVCSSGKILHSMDAITWTQVTNGFGTANITTALAG